MKNASATTPTSAPASGAEPRGMLAGAIAPKPASMPQQQAGQQAGQDSGAYDRAMEIARQALYGKEAARNVAKALKAAPDPVEALANTAYEMVAIADEATEGQVPDEELVALASEILGEVADIATAAGIEVKGATIAKAMQMMLVRYVSEQGMDPTQLQQAMAQVDPEQLGAELESKVA